MKVKLASGSWRDSRTGCFTTAPRKLTGSQRRFLAQVEGKTRTKASISKKLNVEIERVMGPVERGGLGIPRPEREWIKRYKVVGKAIRLEIEKLPRHVPSKDGRSWKITYPDGSSKRVSTDSFERMHRMKVYTARIHAMMEKHGITWKEAQKIYSLAKEKGFENAKLQELISF